MRKPEFRCARQESPYCTGLAVCCREAINIWHSENRERKCIRTVFELRSRIGAAVEQHIHNIGVAIACRHHQRRAHLRTTHFGAGAGVQQSADRFNAALVDGMHEWRPAVDTCSEVEISAVAGQGPD